ncbi:MAG: glycosyltransferase family 39 protein, partial [Acidobacteria bacterium]|nr:glycosyltransferase family 39 protein [Acidobacteriota bacterium]
MPEREASPGAPQRLAGIAIPAVLAAAKLAVHLAVNLAGGYGWFRDEFYYIACSDRLAWGYVDHPPLSILLLRISRLLLGDSLVAVRFLPALAGAAVVFLTAWMAGRLGGGRAAQLIAGLTVLAAPRWLGGNNLYSMNSFDLLAWTTAAWIMVEWVRSGEARWWGWLGLALGLGLLNKISVLWLGLGLAAGILLTPYRRALRTRGPWIAAGIAALLFLPHLAWQQIHGWPTVEFMRNATSFKMADVSPLAFLVAQIRATNPVAFPLWAGGLLFLLCARDGRPYRILGIAFAVVFLLLALSGRSRAGYLGPAFPMLLAAGGLVLERAARHRRFRWIKEPVVALLLVAGAALAPLGLPVLPVRTYVEYARILGVDPSTEERKEVGDLPQHYADMHGWNEIVDTVERAWRSTGESDPGDWAVLAPNYGDAGALELLGRGRGLPRAISGH